MLDVFNFHTKVIVMMIFPPEENVEDYPVGLLAPLNAIGTSLQVINSLQWASPSHDHFHDHGDDGNVIMKT